MWRIVLCYAVIAACAIGNVAQAADPPATRSAVLRFNKPTQYTDGSAILSGVVITYRVYSGAKGEAKTEFTAVANSPVTINNGLRNGENCWQVTAIANNVESAMSNEVCKTFPWPAPKTVVVTIE